MTPRYLADDRPEFRHPDDDPPPLGTKLLILTRGGVCVVGTWSTQEGAVAWSPMPRVPIELKRRLAKEGSPV